MRLTPLAPLLILPLLVACGKELTAGGRQRVDVVATDREPSAMDASRNLQYRSDGHTDPVGLAVPAVGQVEVTVLAALRHETGEVVEVSEESVTAVLTIGGQETVPLGSASVRTGGYTHLILTFEYAAARIGVGPLEGLVQVVIGPQPLLVEKEIELEVGDENIETVEVNLNTVTWIGLAVGGFVTPDQFAAAVEVRVR